MASASEVRPESLRLAIVPGLADLLVEALQDELASRGDGLVTLDLAHGFDVQHTLDAEQQIVRAVADGRLDLGWVGVRTFWADPCVAPLRQAGP